MLYLCRHGETEWSLSGQHTSYTDLPLTKRGEWQAAVLRKQLEGISFAKVFTSPSLRARQTAEGLSPAIEPNAVEWNYGDYEGRTSEEIHQKRPDWDLFTHGAPNGETPEQVKKRAEEVIHHCLSYSGPVLLFSHGHFLRVLAATFLKLEVRQAALFSLSTASLSILGKEKSRPVISLWNRSI